eukprot:769774_1
MQKRERDSNSARFPSNQGNPQKRGRGGGGGFRGGRGFRGRGRGGGRGFRGRGGRGGGRGFRGRGRGGWRNRGGGRGGHKRDRSDYAAGFSMFDPATKRRRVYHPGQHIHRKLITAMQESVKDIPFEFATENSVGILQFANEMPEIQCIIKQRYSDFLVEEIGLDGQIQRLRSFELPPEEQKIKEEEPTEEDAGKALDEIKKFVCDTKAAEFEKFVSPDADILGDFIFHTEQDKAKRTAVHIAIKRYFPQLTSSTVEDSIGDKCIRLTYSRAPAKQRKGAPNEIWKSRKADPRWPKGRPDYLRFVLYKENFETHKSMRLLADRIRMNAKFFSYAGMKDKRGITSQLMSVKRVTAKRLTDAVKNIKQLSVGNFQYSFEKINLGDLMGNHFVVTLRDVVGPSDADLNAALEAVRAHGFINYYGMQRFGTGAVATHVVGRAVVRKDWNQVLALLLLPRDGEMQEYAHCREMLVDTADLGKVLNEAPTRNQTIASLLEALTRAPNDLAGAFMKLPRKLSMLFPHAYQSYVWNSAVSYRLAEFPQEPIVGDLVYVKDEQESTCQDGSAQNPSQPAARVSAKSKRVRALTEADLATGCYSIFDVVMPLPGDDVEMPKNAVGEKIVAIMKEDGVEMKMFKSNEKSLHLFGDYRNIIVRAGNLSWKIKHYDDVNVQLAMTSRDELRGGVEPEDVPNGQMRALVLAFDLPTCSYATMLIREVSRQKTDLASLKSMNPEKPVIDEDGEKENVSVAAPNATTETDGMVKMETDDSTSGQSTVSPVPSTVDQTVPVDQPTTVPTSGTEPGAQLEAAVKMELDSDKPAMVSTSVTVTESVKMEAVSDEPPMDVSNTGQESVKMEAVSDEPPMEMDTASGTSPVVASDQLSFKVETPVSDESSMKVDTVANTSAVHDLKLETSTVDQSAMQVDGPTSTFQSLKSDGESSMKMDAAEVKPEAAKMDSS